MRLVVSRALGFVISSSVAVATAACGGVDATPGPLELGKEVPSQPAQPPAYDTAKAPVCDAPTPLLVHHDDKGRVDRLHAELTARSLTGPYLVDTGSMRSFVTYESDEASHWAKTVIGCESTSLPIIARLRPGTTPDGQPQSGVIGSDLLAHGSVLDLDLLRGTLGWYQPAPPSPAGSVTAPIEWRNGWLIASVVLDGKPAKLVVDTGSTNVIWLDANPRPGEVREETVDGTANKVVLYHGDGKIAFGANGAAFPVPVDRTDDFATLQSLVMSLGGDVQGLLGMTAMGRERVILGREQLVIVPPK